MWCCGSRIRRRTAMLSCVYCNVDAQVFNSQTAAIHSQKTPTHQLTLKAAGVTRSYLFSTSAMWCSFQSTGKRNYICYSMLHPSLSVYCAIQAWTTSPFTTQASSIIELWALRLLIWDEENSQPCQVSLPSFKPRGVTFKHFENKWSPPPPHTFDPCLSCPSVVLYWGNCASKCC